LGLISCHGKGNGKSLSKRELRKLVGPAVALLLDDTHIAPNIDHGGQPSLTRERSSMNNLGFYDDHWLHGPFGSPDASRADAHDSYIPITGAAPDIHHLKRKLQERIIIGKKGAGKTIYLKTLMEALPRVSDGGASGENWYVLREIFSLSTEQVLGVSQSTRRYHSAIMRTTDIYVDPKARAKDLWMKCWENAIIATIYWIFFSKSADQRFRKIKDDIVNAPDFRDDMEFIHKFMNQLPQKPSPIIQIKAFLQLSGPKLSGLRRYSDDLNWDLVYSLLSSLVSNAPPIAIFVDAIDDDFDKAPEAWLDCQEGLFRAIFKFLNRADNFSSRVHVVVALREVAYSSLLRSEHASRYLTDSHVRYITWDISAAKSFLVQKLKTLTGTPLALENLDPVEAPIARWLGFEKLTNGRNTQELVLDYVLRHTRLLPRDIIIMGNALCAAQQRRAADSRFMSEAKTRDVVSQVGRAIAREAVESAIQEHLASVDYIAELLLLTEEEEKRQKVIGDIDKLVSSDPNAVLAAEKRLNKMVGEMSLLLKGSVASRIEILMSILGKEKFTHDALIDALKASKLIEKDELTTSPFYRFDNILWRHGLLACQIFEGNEHRWRFSWRSGAPDQAELPKGHSLYGFHSSILDLYKDVKAGGNEPVF
jgi:hypothetical protein